MTKPHSDPRGNGFTLVELLIVLAIVAVLVAMLLPGLGRAKELARRTACLALERQYGIAHTNYAVSNRSWFITQGTAENGANSHVTWLMTTVRRNLLAPYMGWPVVPKPTSAANAKQSGRLPMCPSCVVPFLWDPQWAWGGGGYFQLMSVTSVYTGTTVVPLWYQTSPQKCEDSPRLPLVADAVIKYPGSAGPIVWNHAKLGGGGSKPTPVLRSECEGSNVGLVDGSASWRRTAAFSETATGYIAEDTWWKSGTYYRGYW